MITPEEITDYQRIYRAIYKTDIPYEEAQKQWIQLIVLLEVVTDQK